MNERIQELMFEAGWLDDKQFASWNKLHQWQNFDKEKFAELIVRECANIAAKNQAENMDWDISEIIKENFGVEE